MTVKFTRPSINIRETLDQLNKPSGIAGNAMLAAETPQEQFNLIGAGRRNLIINGAMQVAQRGTSFTSYSGYTIDRYKGFGHTYNRIDNGDFYSLRMLWVTGTDANIYYPVELERGQLENGQTYTLSFKYKSAGSPMTLEIFYRTGTTGANVISQISGQTLPDSSGFSEYSITFTCNGRIAAHTALNIRFGNASGTNEIANLQLELGSVATPFEHRSYGEELALCQRYYEIVWANNGGLDDSSVTGRGHNGGFLTSLKYQTTKRATPTFIAVGTLNNIWQGGITSFIDLGAVSRNGGVNSMRMYTASGSVPTGYACHQDLNTGSYIAVEAEL